MIQRMLALVRVTLGIVFIVAAVLKLADVAALAEEVANYRVVPAAVVPYFVCALLGTELTAGAALVTGVKSRAAALLASVMLASFIVAIAQALVRGIDTRCGCFGGTEMASWATVGRDAALLLMSSLVLTVGPGRLRRARSSAPSSSPGH